MATCKDCIHYEVGIDYVCDEHFAKETNQTTREMFSPIGCENFKNKADFVEVVRCKDCEKFIEKGEEFLKNDVYGICEKSRTGFFDDGEEVYGNDFCSRGVRKD